MTFIVVRHVHKLICLNDKRDVLFILHSPCFLDKCFTGFAFRILH